MQAGKRVITVPLALCAFAGLAFLTGDFWLPLIGSALVDAQAPEPADAVLVLGGDFRGDRILKACELVKAGYAPTILVSGPMDWYGVNEAELAIRFATSRGCPGQALVPVVIKAFSTTDEAGSIAAELARRNIHRLLIVTSDYHTRRAGRIYRQRLQDTVRIRMVAAPDPYFKPSEWWRHREGRKTVFYEVSKTIAGWMGL